METHNGQQHRPTTEFTVGILQPGHKMCAFIPSLLSDHKNGIQMDLKSGVDKSV